ncbi:torsin-4A isoform X2 [Sarcophilus harrisii]|uniref:torsin-4A isoform X2 n=1 Tax=Sarcophilus harrisii TaxID=9305 RepID=UPI001301AACE|nr:torsin-4A isoform X2 [Sarcophilus harrisii]
MTVFEFQVMMEMFQNLLALWGSSPDTIVMTSRAAHCEIPRGGSGPSDSQYHGVQRKSDLNGVSSRAMEGGQPSPRPSQVPSGGMVSSQVRAIIRLRRKFRVLRRSRTRANLPGEAPLALTPSPSQLLQRQISFDRAKLGSTPTSHFHHRANFEKPQYFTFEAPVESSLRKKKRRKSRVVLYPESSRKYLPTEQKSKAKRCLLLLVAIVCFQILNAIENLDDNLQKYDLDGLEKALQRGVFGQKAATDSIMELLRDYLATHIHSQPLVISFNGPSGVGKSHVGRLLAKHFRSVMDGDFVLQYYVMHHCPDPQEGPACQQDLAERITDMVTRAEVEEKIPVFILDEVEFMSPALLDTLHGFLQPQQSNEFLNAIYVLISSIGGSEVTRLVLQNVSSQLSPQRRREELSQAVHSLLAGTHPLWEVAEVVPFVLLDKWDIMNCFLDEMVGEGFYPNQSRIESLAGQLSYYNTKEGEFSVTGCKQVVAKVNLL